MKISKFIISTIISVLASASLFAQNKFITITDPYTEDNEVTKYEYSSSIEDVKYTFTGKVASGCKAIRVLWTNKRALAIDEYLYTVNNAVGRRDTNDVDDFFLKKYKPGDTTFQYNASGKFDNLSFGSNYYRFIAIFNDGSVKMTNLTVYVHAGGAAEMGKPVIYLYPEKKQNVKVNVKPKGKFTVTIPEIGKGWHVVANPDGKIIDKKSNKEYPYLFWESVDSSEPIDMSEGFVVSKADLNSFLKEKLSFQGLNDKEIADFLEYWEPKLNVKPYVFITFYSLDKINSLAPLTVNPKPDTVIRVYFDYKLLDEKISVKEQVLSKGERKGFVVTEWGGRLYK